MKTQTPHPNCRVIIALVSALFLCLGAQIDRASAASANLELWQNTANTWGGTVQAGNSMYGEGNSVPARFVKSLAAGSTHTLKLKYDFSSGADRFIDFLANVDATVAGVNPISGVANAANKKFWAIPADPQVGARQFAGSLTTWNVTVTQPTAANYSFEGSVRVLTLTFKVDGTSGNKNVVFAWGAHLAKAADWAPGKGAESFSGASRKVFTKLNSASDENVSINPSAIISSTDLAITKLTDPQAAPVQSGDLLTYFINVENKGLITATGVTVTDILPLNASLVSVLQSQGTYSVGANSTLTFALGNLAPGSTALAAIQITNLVSPSFVGRLTNTASVTSTVTDPILANNTSTVVTEVTDGTDPVITCPANIIVNTSPAGSPSASVTFAATATDNVGVTSLTYSQASGSAFLIGTTTVTATATDAAGNSSQCSFTVTVRDVEAPVITCPADVVIGTESGLATAVVSFSVTATDNSGFAPMLAYGKNPGSRQLITVTLPSISPVARNSWMLMGLAM